MGNLREKPWVRRVAALVRYVARLQIPLYASHASFFIVLAVFPALVLLLGFLRHTGLGVELLTELMEGILPKALQESAAKLILKVYRSTTGTVLSLSAVTSLWSASRGVHGLLVGLNGVYEVTENRSWLHTRLVSVGYTFAFLLALILTLVLHVFGNTLVGYLALQDSFLFRLLEELIGWRYLLLLVVQMAVFTAIYMVLPNERNRFADSLPGALLATIGWQVFTHLYSVYALRFTQLSLVYGSVYAVALAMLWLYCCVSIIFYGGTLNRQLRKWEEG